MRKHFRYVRALSSSTYVNFSSVQRLECNRFSFLTASFLRRLANDSPAHVELIVQQAEDAFHHRFNLLGSGLVEVRHGVICKGLNGIRYDAPPIPVIDAEGRWLEKLINIRNRAGSMRIWRLVDPQYRAIDWQLDFKSGYRWQEKDWHGKIRFGHLPGLDVKVPWELSRMQHLPVLALAAGYAKAGLCGGRAGDEYAREVRNQMLDFIATNPPGFGVNWSCAMDVAIRVSNMLIAYDILASTGFQFDHDFEVAFAENVYAHARHVSENLEWSAVYRGNHYLANIAGLLFTSCYLKGFREADQWLCFATEELIREIEYQFHADGSNFEASVCYHRLSSEIVLWACALLDNVQTERLEVFKRGARWVGPVPPPRSIGPAELYPVPGSSQLSPIPPWCRDRLDAMALFTKAMTRPDGLVVQFGDNDSGRFVAIGPCEQVTAAGDPGHPAWSLDHRSLVAGVEAYQGRNNTDPDSMLLAGFAGKAGATATSTRQNFCGLKSVGTSKTWHELLTMSNSVPAENAWRTEFKAASGLRDSIEVAAFDGMGCYVMRSPRVFLAIRCGEIGIQGLGAHAHCDQLAIELVIDGQNHTRDPGSYIYTADPNMRNLYRSVRAHHAPRHREKEPADLSRGVFELRGAPAGECLFFGDEGFVGRHQGYGFDIYRLIQLLDDRVIVIDFSPDGHEVTDPAPATLDFSPSYGHRLNSSS